MRGSRVCTAQIQTRKCLAFFLKSRGGLKSKRPEIKRSTTMRKLLPFLAFAAAVAVATPALAYPDDRYPVEPYVAPLTGAAVGTAVGVGLYNGWHTGAL
jgi:hypothetical protein